MYDVMYNGTGSNKLSVIICVSFLLIASIYTYLRGIHHISINDDVSYQFVLGEHVISSPDNDYTNKVDSFKELVQSQRNHYLYSNGRAIIHTIVQIFTGMLGYRAYAIFVSLLLVFTLALFIRYSCKREYRTNPLVYALAVICWLYLYPSPEGAFFWVVYGMNYLYPMSIVLIFLLVFRHVVNSNMKIQLYEYIVLPILGFIVGWSHEGFALPLSGALFIYIIKYHRCIHRRVLILTLSLWIGTILLTFSPGNFSRIGTSILANLFNGIDIYMRLRLMWVALFVIIMARVINPVKFKSKFKEYEIVWYAWIFGCIFGLIANTGVWSLTGAEFFSAIIMFSLLSILFSRFTMGYKLINTMSIMVLIMVVIHQSQILHAAIRIEKQERDFISEYKISEDGLVVEPEIELSPIVKPFVLNWFESQTLNYILFSMSVSQGSCDKKPILLGKKDYDAIFNPSKFFVPQNAVPGNAKFYEGDRFYWVKNIDYQDSVRYKIQYFPLKLADSPYLLITLKILFEPNSFETSEIIRPDACHNPSNAHKDVKMIEKSSWRKVKGIDIE